MTPIHDINLKEKLNKYNLKKTMGLGHKNWRWLIQAEYSRYDRATITELVFF